MGRFGEAMGTIARAASKPAVQALVAGGLSTALTGNPLYGLGQAYKFGSNRAMDGVYRNVLNQYGVDVPELGMLGNISSSDMRNIGNMAETNAWHEYLKQRNADELARKTAKDEADKEYKQERIQVQKQNAETNAYKAKNGTTVRHTGGSGKGGKTTTKVTDHPDWNSDLAGYTSILTNPKYAARADEAKARFIKKYGVDPMKYIKL